MTDCVLCGRGSVEMRELPMPSPPSNRLGLDVCWRYPEFGVTVCGGDVRGTVVMLQSGGLPADVAASFAGRSVDTYIENAWVWGLRGVSGRTVHRQIAGLAGVGAPPQLAVPSLLFDWCGWVSGGVQRGYHSV